MSNTYNGHNDGANIAAGDLAAGIEILHGKSDDKSGWKVPSKGTFSTPIKDKAPVKVKKKQPSKPRLPTETKTKPNSKKVKRARQLSRRLDEAVVIPVSCGMEMAQDVVVHVAASGKGKKSAGKDKANVSLLDLKTGKSITHKSEAGLDALQRAIGRFPKPEKNITAFSSKNTFDRNKVVKAALKNAQKQVSY